MSDDKLILEHADLRRAAALVAHFGQDNPAGVIAILQEAVDAMRTTQLLMSVLALYNEIVPEVRSELGMSLMSSYILKLAGMEARA